MKPLDQKKISSILGSTMVPLGHKPSIATPKATLAAVTKAKAKRRKKKKLA